ncbi:MAG: hypothetical protein LUG95_07550 [Clostridiales bacterium]|nr:hypothetical protein [Clostridiales bacterium]
MSFVIILSAILLCVTVESKRESNIRYGLNTVGTIIYYEDDIYCLSGSVDKLPSGYTYKGTADNCKVHKINGQKIDDTCVLTDCDEEIYLANINEGVLLFTSKQDNSKIYLNNLIPYYLEYELQ